MKWRAVGTVCASLLLGLALGVHQQIGAGIRSLSRQPDIGLHVHQTAPNFKLYNGRDLRPVELRAFRDQVVLLNFWDTSCPHCQREIPTLAHLQSEFAAKGFKVVGVIVNHCDPLELAVKEKRLGINYVTLMGSERVVQTYGGVPMVPTSYLIDRQGRIVDTFVGGRETKHPGTRVGSPSVKGPCHVRRRFVSSKEGGA